MQVRSRPQRSLSEQFDRLGVSVIPRLLLLSGCVDTILPANYVLASTCRAAVSPSPASDLKPTEDALPLQVPPEPTNAKVVVQQRVASSNKPRAQGTSSDGPTSAETQFKEDAIAAELAEAAEREKERDGGREKERSKEKERERERERESKNRSQAHKAPTGQPYLSASTPGLSASPDFDQFSTRNRSPALDRSRSPCADSEAKVGCRGNESWAAYMKTYIPIHCTEGPAGCTNTPSRCGEPSRG